MQDTYEILLEHFRVLPDPRVERGKIHSLEVILFIALCSSLTGGQSFYDMQDFAEAREDWLKEHIGMTSVPSHDTFNRVFQAISPAHFGECLVSLTSRLRERISGEMVAIDGKTHRGVEKNGGSPLHTLNAWTVGKRLVLGQLAVEEKSNEIVAAPQLIDILDLKKCVVTMDAMHCQKATAEKIIGKGADYVLAIKGNQPMLRDEMVPFMDKLAAENEPGFSSVEKGHGRLEIRRYWQSEDIGWFADKNAWRGLKSFCMVESTREIGESSETSRRYYISSLALDEARAAGAIRSHWDIENALHWRLDVVFNEDQAKARCRNAAQNLATLRALCMNLMKKLPGKGSLKGKRCKAALNPAYLVQALRI